MDPAHPGCESQLCSVMSVWYLEIGMVGVFIPGKSANATKSFPYLPTHPGSLMFNITSKSLDIIQITVYYHNLGMRLLVPGALSLYIWCMFDYDLH